MCWAFPDPTWAGGRGGGVPAGQSQCSGTRSYSGKQHGACERLWRSIRQALRSSLGPAGPGELQMNASRCGGKSEPGDRRPGFQCHLDSGRGANPRSLPRPLPHVQTDRIPVSRLDTSWAQNVLGQRLLFRLCQLVYLQPLPLLAWGCFHPFPGLSESGPGTGEPGGSPPSFTFHTHRRIQVALLSVLSFTAPDSSGVLRWSSFDLSYSSSVLRPKQSFKNVKGSWKPLCLPAAPAVKAQCLNVATALRAPHHPPSVCLQAPCCLF